jgi:hypothetical protein
VAAWVKEERGSGRGQSGLSGRDGLSGPEENDKAVSTRSTKSTKSTPSTYPELAANAALVLIAVACSLLDRQLAALATAFEHEVALPSDYTGCARARAAGR